MASFTELLHVLVPIDIPVSVQRLRIGIIDFFYHFIFRIFFFDDHHLEALWFLLPFFKHFRLVFAVGLIHDGLRPQFGHSLHISPHQCFLTGDRLRVKVVRVGWHADTLIGNLINLSINVREFLWFILKAELVLRGIKFEALQLQVIEYLRVGACQGVEECVQVLPPSLEVNIIFDFFFVHFSISNTIQFMQNYQRHW